MTLYVVRSYIVGDVWEESIIRGYFINKENAEKSIPEDKDYFCYTIDEIETED